MQVKLLADYTKRNGKIIKAGAVVVFTNHVAQGLIEIGKASPVTVTVTESAEGEEE